jgi:hypothetical protein
MAISLTACGGGGSSSSGNGSTGGGNPPVLPQGITVTPANASTQVITDTEIIASFNQDILGTSIDNNSFTLTGNNQGIVSSAISFDGANNTATLSPIKELAFLENYTAALTTSITDLIGNAVLTTDFVWSFTTEDGVWLTEQLLETMDLGDAAKPQIALDDLGNAIAVWEQRDGVTTDVWSNRYTPATGWGTPEKIEADNTLVRDPQIAMAPGGNALAVWSQKGIWANHYTPGAGWGSAQLIEATAPLAVPGSTIHPQITMDGTGNGIAVWTQFLGAGSGARIFVNHYDVTNGWEAAQLLDTVTSTNAQDASDPQIAIAPNGNAVVVWDRERGLGNRAEGATFASYYTQASGWSTPVRLNLNTNTPVSGAAPQVAIDPAGNAIAVWNEFDPTNNINNSIWTSRYSSGGNWGAAIQLTDDPVGDIAPDIALDPDGNGLLVWTHSPSGSNHIHAKRYTSANGWGAGVTVLDTDTSASRKPKVAIDRTGKALAVWLQPEATGSAVNGQLTMWSSRYLPANNSWSVAENIEVFNGDPSDDPQIAIGSDGRAFAVWKKSDGTQQQQNIWSNRFD